jgi:hypothetical protein
MVGAVFGISRCLWRHLIMMTVSMTAIGPALIICPECGEVVGRELLHVGPKTYVLPHPKTCPACNAMLGFHARPAPDRCQVRLEA